MKKKNITTRLAKERLVEKNDFDRMGSKICSRFKERRKALWRKIYMKYFEVIGEIITRLVDTKGTNETMLT